MKNLPVICLFFVVLLLSCSKSPDPGQFAPPQLGDVRIVSKDCYSLVLQAPVQFAAQMGDALQQMEYGFQILAGEAVEPVTVRAANEGNMLVATVEGLSSGTGYVCTPFVRKGDFEAMGISTELSTEDPFRDANFKSYVLQNFDMDKDGGISQKEALAVDTIKVITENIVDLAGVELFKELLYLYCSGVDEDKFKFDVGMEGALAHLDVRANTKLAYLFCYHNKLAELDLRNNVQLKGLDINNTLITSIDLSSNYQLEWLEGHNCPYLEEVVYARSGNLRSVFMDQCNFISVDISMLPNINSYNCAYSHKLESLDFSKNEYLAVLGVAGLPLVKKLDLSNNPNIVDVDCVDCPSLDTVYLHRDAKVRRLEKPEHTIVVVADK